MTTQDYYEIEKNFMIEVMLLITMILSNELS